MITGGYEDANLKDIVPGCRGTSSLDGEAPQGWHSALPCTSQQDDGQIRAMKPLQAIVADLY